VLSCGPALSCAAPPARGLDPELWPEVAHVGLPIGDDAFAMANVYLVTRGHVGYACVPGTPEDERSCPLDFTALRWDAGAGQYTASRTEPGVSSPWPFDDHVMWGMPIRAPIDGEVIACWRRMPDDDEEGDDVNCPGGAGRCVQGGNHVNLRTVDGQLLFFGHLQRDSIPAELCPIADELLYAGDPKTCTLGGTWAGLRSGSRLDLRGLAPIPVRAGDLLGRVGASGSGDGIHFHVHAKPYAHDGENPCEGPSLPIAFDGARFQPRRVGVAPAPDGWRALDDEILPIDGSSLLVDRE
jgi:hypothetical protein